MQAELRDIERAVASGTREAGPALRTELRRQVASARLGQRLANSWRDKHYPNQRLDAASLVYTKAPQIIRAFDEGALIRSKRGRFLAIPTANAPRKCNDGRPIKPSRFPDDRLGPLWFVPQSSGPSLLVVDGVGLRSAARPADCVASDMRQIAPGAADRSYHGRDVPAGAADEATEAVIPGRQERHRRAHAHGDPHQRPGRDDVWLIRGRHPLDLPCAVRFGTLSHASASFRVAGGSHRFATVRRPLLPGTYVEAASRRGISLCAHLDLRSSS
jgi:Family of unknown function (DUF6441)